MATTKTAKELLALIERVLPDGGEWCTLDKAEALASMVLALRPKKVVEIGVWQGGSLIPLALALKHNGHGMAIAIDPWSNAASVAGEHDPANVKWWGEVDHEAAYLKFKQRVRELQLDNFVEVWRATSDASNPPVQIDILHIDGNHTEQAIRDARRYAANVRIGGILILDDLNWAGGGVLKAADVATELGFDYRYDLGSGVVMMRSRIPG